LVSPQAPTLDLEQSDDKQVENYKWVKAGGWQQAGGHRSCKGMNHGRD